MRCDAGRPLLSFRFCCFVCLVRFAFRCECLCSCAGSVMNLLSCLAFLRCVDAGSLRTQALSQESPNALGVVLILRAVCRCVPIDALTAATWVYPASQQYRE